VIAKVVDLDKTDNSWIFETEDGKLVVVKSREIERFLKEVQPESVAGTELHNKNKDIFAKANAAKIAAQYGFCTVFEANAIIDEANAVAEKLNATLKEKMAKANAAKIAAKHSFCSKEIAESLAQEVTEAKMQFAPRVKVKSGEIFVAECPVLTLPTKFFWNPVNR
jgi:hypothetical protein